MSLFRRALAIVAGIVIVVVAMELVLRALPVSEDINAADPRSDWPIRTMTAHTTYTHSTGWRLRNVRHGTTNDYGYVSPFDYAGKSHGIAILGDSFVESLMNDYSEAISGALASDLQTARPVMNFGVSGASMAHYLGSAPLIGARFHPDWAVVVIGMNDFTTSFSAGPGRFRWSRHAADVELVPERRSTRYARFIRSLAIVRYVRGSLRMNLHTLFAKPTPPDAKVACEPAQLSKRDQAVVHAFVDRFASSLQVPASHVVLVFDSNRRLIYRNGDPRQTCPTRDSIANRSLMKLARNAGYQVLDTRPLFTDYYERTRQQVDHWPRDGHWNGIGHGLVAQRVAQIIERASRGAGQRVYGRGSRAY